MKKIALCLLLLPYPALATDSPPERMMSKVAFDWNKDGKPDEATLMINSKSYINLSIELSQPDGPKVRDVFLPEVGQLGDMPGTEPSIDLARNGSLLLSKGNSARRQAHWQQTLTASYRDKQFMVTNYSYTTDNSKCEVNLLTGKGTLDGKAFDTATKAFPLSEWKESAAPKECTNRSAQ